MKRLLILTVLLSATILSFGQTHSEKINIAKDSSFKSKVTHAAYMAAKNFVADTEANDNVKRFSQILITTINNPDAAIIEGLGYYIQSIPETVSININSTQQNIDFALPFVYQLFAKAWYKDLQ